jgi:hypothetical protein
MPLNRMVKPDYLCAQLMARQQTAELREGGKWETALTKG